MHLVLGFAASKTFLYWLNDKHCKNLFRITICGNADGLIIPHYGITTNEDFVVYFVLLGGLKLDSATPVLRAASATAVATALPTRGSKAAGMIYSSVSSSSVMRFAMALAAAIFISSFISLARTSKASQTIPGNTSTLLIWFG